VKKRLLFVFGTRPEAIKMAPVILEAKKYKVFDVIVCVTAQHREMLDQVLKLFEIKPDIDLDIMTPNQTLSGITAKVISEMEKIIKSIKPDVVIVQGDTTTVMATGLVCFYNKVPLAHIEAGLRSFDIYSPFPEELNRKVVSLFAEYNFAPTTKAAAILKDEGVDEKKIYMVGNTVIDAMLSILAKPAPRIAYDLIEAIGNKKILLVTAHRRENFGERLISICNGLKRIVEENDEVAIIYPVHLNPNVRESVYKILNNHERIFLIEPVEYDALVHLMKHSYIVLTDSGGIQEEAPTLGKPVLVMRTETERPEGIEAGTAKLVGPNEETIVTETNNLLKDSKEYNKMAKAVNPYGDGQSAKRIIEILMK
jgi:UDP-N-acetylglucosamine 2-epimerase (non-hydrolysing)